MSGPSLSKMNRPFPISSLIFLALPLCAEAAEQAGSVRSGLLPVARVRVTLLSASTSRDIAPATLGQALSDARGFFSIVFSPGADG